MANFISYDRNQGLLLSPDLREWVGDDDLVHFICDAVEHVDIRAFRGGHGKAQYHPRMMLGLLIYCYANGIFSSRRIERATYRDVAVRYLTADTHPDHDTIAVFRRNNPAAFPAAFSHVLLMAKELKLLKPGMVSTYDFRPPNPDAKSPPEPKARWRIKMKEKLGTEDAKAKYKRRKCTVEPVFGIIKNVLGFNRFSLRGIKNVKTEWLLVTLAYNCKRLYNLKVA